jgi:hypothetical protein
MFSLKKKTSPLEMERKIKEHIGAMILTLKNCSDHHFSEEFITDDKLKIDPIAYTDKLREQSQVLERLFFEDIEVNKSARIMILKAIKDATTTLKTEF